MIEVLRSWEPKFADWVRESMAGLAVADPSHDLSHYQRVSRTALSLAGPEGAPLEVVVPAAWLHDLVVVEKSDPRRAQASRLSGEAAVARLREARYAEAVDRDPAEIYPAIEHAIAAHSFSARIEPRTPAARVVQDADRLDGLGAIGIARVFAVSGRLGRMLYHPDDPFRETGRPIDDLTFSLDHFEAKLFRVAEALVTEAGRREGARRAATMREYLARLRAEIA